ncbi:hypothetical protein HHL28_07855 [Aerophototrophica crusticola]|uniref:Anti-sigma factor NepR domain-containing protein n=2 Tax=Aerophototrophica crusticola TaxID=1709002 RepID=A0A858RBU5_9PROT|nr:hypothetical protein HHL28_07855 [Rhodospirillaceae bacterium B3]
MNDINAYLDGALGDDERQEVERALEHDPEAQALMGRYRQQVDELHRLYDKVLDEPVPDSMLSLLRARPSKPS